MKIKTIFSLAVLGALSFSTEAEVKMPAVFSDGMVLQQQSEVALWGSTDSKSGKVTITPSWDNRTYTVSAGKDGKWRTKIATPAYGGPYYIEISDGDRISLNNVLIGDVWVCSGQSNMDMRVSGRYGDAVIGAQDAIFAPANPDIRMFNVGAKLVGEPLEDCTGKWEEASCETVPEFSAAAYFFARKLNELTGIPIGVIHASYGGSRCEAWMSNEAAAKYKDDKRVQNASCLYNGMLNPVVGYGIKGCLWYQGEANTDYPELYTTLFPDMVRDWRSHWDCGEFPFLYAQIAPYNYGDKKNSAFLREAQLKSLDLVPNSGMVVLMDIGRENTIHPMDKKPVGDRFAYLALSKAYGKKVEGVEGPKYVGMEVDGDKLIVKFENTGKGLTTYRQPITGFEIAGEDHVFHPAKVRYTKDLKGLELTSPDVPKPVAARYDFVNYAKGCMFNSLGMPLSSFRTDNWEK